MSNRAIKTISEVEFRTKTAEVLEDADHGIQTKVVDATGKIRCVIGLNETRLFPNPSPDPLDEIKAVLATKET
jgi:hypothetical protein